MKTMISPDSRGDLGQHRLQPLLELAAVFGAGDHRAEVERQEALVLEAFRHVAVDDAQGEPLDDRGLADARLADQHGIVLGAARQHLDRAADLLVAADDRVELALARRLGQVARVFLQGVVAFLGRGALGLAPLAQILDRGVEGLRRDMAGGERLARRRVAGHRQRQEQPLDRDIAVAGLLGDLFRLVEDARQLGAEIDLPGAAALDLGLLGRARRRPPPARPAGSPPAARIRLAQSPSLSSSSTFKRCSGMRR